MTPGKKTYRRIYLSSLTLIALLVAMANIVIDYIVAEESLMVEVNEIGGRQHMLSERVGRLLQEYATENTANSRQLISAKIDEALSAFMLTHKHLIRGQFSNGEQVIFEDNIDNLFFDAPHYLDEKARIFMYNTREVLSDKWSPMLNDNYYLNELQQLADHSLRTSLNILTGLYTQNAKQRIFRLRVIVAVLLVSIILVVIALGIFVFRPLFNRITNQEERLHQLAYNDALTNCRNRRSFFENAGIEFGRSRRSSLPFSVLYLDVDYLKTINDSFGHAMGDIAIQEIARICQENIRDIDILGRIGGDEFGILLPGCDLLSATQTAERLRLGMADHTIPGISGEMQLSISIGVACVIDRDKNAFETINRADQNLYKAKRTGRNLIIAA